MLREVPAGSSVLDACVGQAVKLALPGTGTTGYRWEARGCKGLAIERLPAQASSTFGGRAREVFLVTPEHKGDIRLVLLLNAPWRREPVEVREVEFKVR